MKPRFLTSLFFVTAICLAWPAGNSRRDAPNWAVDALRQFKRAGLLTGYPDNDRRSGPVSNYEAAVATYASWTWMKKCHQDEIDLKAKVTKGGRDKAASQDKLNSLWASRFRVTTKDVDTLFNLTREFSRELRKLGVDRSMMRAMLDRSVVDGALARSVRSGQYP